PDGHAESLSRRRPGGRPRLPAAAGAGHPSLVNGAGLAVLRDPSVVSSDEGVDAKVTGVVQSLAPAHSLVISESYGAQIGVAAVAGVRFQRDCPNREDTANGVFGAHVNPDARAGPVVASPGLDTVQAREGERVGA